MTSKRTMLVAGQTPEDATDQATQVIERQGSKVVWLSEPEPVVVFGLPVGVTIYEIRAVIRFAA